MTEFQYILTHSSRNLTVEYSPLNWETLNMVFGRDKVYHSVLRSQVLEVEFPFDGKAYIDSIYETYGIDTDIGCEIKYLNKQSKTYITLYTGIIDLSEWLKMRDTTSVKLIDSSVMAKFAARDEVAVPLNRTETIDGDTLASYTYLNVMTVTPVDIYEQILMDFSASISTITSGNTDTSESLDIEEVDWDESLRQYLNGSGDAESMEYNAGCTLNWDLSGTGQVQMRVRFVRNGGGEDIIGYQTQIDSGSGSVSGTLSNTINLPDTGYLGRMYVQIGVTGTYTGTITVTDGSLQVWRITAGNPETETRVVLLHEVGAKLLEIITGVTNPLNCSMFGRTDSQPRTYGSDGDYSLTALATGDMLRLYTFGDKPLATSFQDFFKSVDALFNLGMWYNGTEFQISDKEDFYKTSKIITLGEVQDLEVSIATDEYFNKILSGYQETLSYDEVNGNQNFNVPVEYANDGKRITNSLDVQSIYHGDDYGIELARKAGKELNYSEDTQFDEQIFFIWGERDGGNYSSVPGSDFDIVEGIYAPDSRLNLHITPKRNLLRHLNRLSIPLFKSSGATSYLSKQFELDLKTELTHEDQVDEIGDLDFADLEEPLFYPELYNFIAPLTNAHILQLQSDPHGYVEFDYIGETKSGYIVEVSAEPFNRKGNWTLIRRNPNRT